MLDATMQATPATMRAKDRALDRDGLRWRRKANIGGRISRRGLPANRGASLLLLHFFTTAASYSPVDCAAGKSADTPPETMNAIASALATSSGWICEAGMMNTCPENA